MSIALVMPVMRPESALLVLDNLSKQTTIIDRILIIDNGGNFKPPSYCGFDIEIIEPRKNKGTNWAWNKAYNLDFDFVGFIGDDYSFGPHLIQILIESFDKVLNPPIGAVTATIFKDRPFPVSDLSNAVYMRIVGGKGHMGAILFKKELLQSIPKIPKEFFVFFGDDWIGHWIQRRGKEIYETGVGIGHKYKTDLKVKLDYPKMLKEERNIWESWKNGSIELMGCKFVNR